MPKNISDLEKTITFEDSDVFVLENQNNTKKAEFGDVYHEMMTRIVPNNAGAHNSIFRGRNLGTKVSDDQKKAIADGTFKDIFVGDFWKINGTTYRVAACDMYLNFGDNALKKHHLVVVPDYNMYSEQMNDSNTTSGGYIGSKMWKTGLDKAKSTIRKDFGSLLIKHRELLTNSTSGDEPNGWTWVDCEVSLMNERQVFGGGSWGHRGYNASYNVGIRHTQLPLFSLAPNTVQIGYSWYWLSDVASSTFFADVSGYGNSTGDNASDSGGVRPFFLIG